jgi:hypothetical protein
MLNVVMLNVIMLSVIMPNVVMLNVSMLKVEMLCHNHAFYDQCHCALCRKLSVVMLIVVGQNVVASKIVLWYISTTTFIIMPFGLPTLSIEIRNGHSE